MSTVSFREFIEMPDAGHRPFTDLELVSLYQQSPAVPVSELSVACGRSVPDFYRTLKRYHVEPSRLRTNQHLVLSYATQGYPVSEIARLTGYTPRNVRYILQKHAVND